jgi:plasmid maintenance system antidote protein VapI
LYQAPVAEKIHGLSLTKWRSVPSGSAAMAIRLAAALGTTPELWMNMQSQHDLWRARQARQPAVRRFAHVAAR